jgi:hypothetical protein
MSHRYSRIFWGQSVPTYQTTRCHNPADRSADLTKIGTKALHAISHILQPRGRSSSPDRGKIFLLSTSSRAVLGPTLLPIQWAPWTLPTGKAAGAWPRLSDSGANLVVDLRWVVPGRTGRLTVGSNLRLDQFMPARQGIQKQKVEALLGGGVLYLVRLEFRGQGIADWPSRVWRRVRITTVALRVVGGDGKGTQCLGL